jgi:site-specific recombinase XerD
MTRKTFRKITTSIDKIALINKENMKLFERFLKDKNIRTSDLTIKGYKSDLMIFGVWCMEFNNNKFFMNITKLEFSDFFAYCMSELKWSGARFSRVRSTLSSLSNFIERYYDTEYPNFRNIINKAIESMPKIPVREKTVLDEKDIDKLFEYLVTNNRNQESAFLSLSIASGARISELLRFTTDIIDPTNLVFNDLFISTTKQIKTKGRSKIGDLKYKFIVKGIFLPYYEKWLVEREEIMKKHNQVHNSIFIKSNGTPATISTVRYWLADWEEFLGVPIYCHLFRHYLVTWLTKAGMSSDLVIQIMGWKSGGPMFDIYNDLEAKDRIWKELDSEELKSKLENSKS